MSVRWLLLASRRCGLVEDCRQDILRFLSLGWPVVCFLVRCVPGSVGVGIFVYGSGFRWLAPTVASLDSSPWAGTRGASAACLISRPPVSVPEWSVSSAFRSAHVFTSG